MDAIISFCQMYLDGEDIDRCVQLGTVLKGKAWLLMLHNRGVSQQGPSRKLKYTFAKLLCVGFICFVFVFLSRKALRLFACTLLPPAAALL